jgi:antitoxin ParD1/3/4
MSKIDIALPHRHFSFMNVSLPQPMEKFIRRKVKIGDYETASEVVREGLRLLQQRDEVWKADVRAKIDAGLASLEAGRGLSEEKVRAKMKKFKARWRRENR